MKQINLKLISFPSSGGILPKDTQATKRKVKVKIKLRSPKGANLPVDAISYRVPLEVTQIIKISDKLCFPVCPRCKVSIEREYMRFCDRCGQRLGWSKIEVAIIVYPEYV